MKDRVYEMLTCGHSVMIFKDGCEMTVVPSNFRNLIPGSFNPLHSGHRKLLWYVNRGAFEISICRYQKEDLTREELERRLDQFKWYANVVVTPHWRFEDKAKSIGGPTPTFHIGYDTAERLLQTETLDWLNNTPIKFVVNERRIGGVVKTISDLPVVPKCFLRGSVPAGDIEISSTIIRKQMGEKTW